MEPLTEDGPEAEDLQKVRCTLRYSLSKMPVQTQALITRQKLRSALWFHVGRVVDEESINLGVNATPQFIASLMELVWAQIGM
jgi:hypothetical protein